ncbi:MAG: DUF554 domain-containing protein [Actinobacteria bacterium]|nr:DUF554 domain-containing protein [Actinomycetota bacterium]MCB8996034.1 DUF554 domain-containing protein [Actinomycetota bacterium]MCB9424431.1 DUF554 domain-containing protein [Actinomycetota bacterium]HRY08417.1 DUF554 domain-containing protein [Candidatus Nanopelagicales bacterium]
MYGLGTVINIAAILVGATIGVLVGHRLPERTRTTVTDALGLVTVVIGGLNVIALRDDAFVEAVGSGVTLLIVLGALLIGGIAGSLLQLEKRLEDVGAWLQARFVDGESSRARFVEGFVDSSLIFCIGPLAVLGALSDGLGQGIEELALKATLDGFASIAFAASLGWGVAASALSVGAWQGLLTVLAVFLGDVMSAAMLSALTATGGVLLLGVGMRLLNIKAVPVGDMLPALLVAPMLTVLVAAVV